MMQRLGERIDEEELHAVKQMNADQSEGEKEIPVLFEEMDGVWLNFQDAHHKKMKKQEMKVFTMYEGWDEEKEKAWIEECGKKVDIEINAYLETPVQPVEAMFDYLYADLPADLAEQRATAIALEKRA